MLLHPTIAKLEQLRLGGMAAALRDQLGMSDVDQMPFMDRIGLLVEQEAAVREDRRITRRLRTAKLRMQASMADLDYRQDRGLSRRVMLHLASCQWVLRRQNILITGPTGVGKSYVACALAHKACLENYRTRYYRLPRLKQLSRTDVLVLDDWGLHGIGMDQQRDLMDLLDDRYTVRSTIATSQYPVDKWHETMTDPTLADAILDRLVNNAHRIELTGESMRKVRGREELSSATD